MTSIIKIVPLEEQQSPFSSVEAYETAERQACQGLPNRVIEAAQCVAFQSVGYPCRIANMRELWRYADVMQEGRLKATFDVLGGLTENELRSIERISNIVIDLTSSFGRRIVPGAALLRAVLVYREIRKDFQGGNILEIGPGCGYVSALLLCDNFSVVVTDTSQAFALWQRQFLNRISDRCLFIPWWDWFDPGEDYQGGPFVAATANHMLNEMHPNALQYLIKRLRTIDAPLYVENFGAEYLRPRVMTERLLREAKIPVKIVNPPIPRDAVVTWSDMGKFWSRYGGVPKSPDEQFLESLR